MSGKVMAKRNSFPREIKGNFHLRYIRLPNHILDLYDDLVYRSEKVIVAKSIITSDNSVIFDGEVVLTRGFQIVYFELTGKWFAIGKIRDMQGRHTGYYCDIVTPPRLLEDGGIELTDLFLDLWVSPDLRYKILDEEELENAYRKGWIPKQLYEKAKKELNKLVHIVKQRKFPPYYIRHLEKELSL